jgi:hypothetical protein
VAALQHDIGEIVRKPAREGAHFRWFSIVEETDAAEETRLRTVFALKSQQLA